VRREQFEHVIASAAEVTSEEEIVVIGSQAIHGIPSSPPEEAMLSMEADVYPLHSPEMANEIDRNLGDGSSFQEAFGVYAHGVGPETVVGPKGWEERLVRVTIGRRVHSKLDPVALCLEPHDLVLAKCARGEERDWEFARAVCNAGIVEREELLRRLSDMDVDPETLAHMQRMLEAL
jgi:hypothetical protein